MRIEVRRSGGFAGIERQGEVDTSAREDEARLRALAELAVSEGHGAPPPGVPDGFAYRITVDGRTAHCADPLLSAAQRELVALVLGEGA
ncbi:protealysin inhibitor emfourin [Streptomyces sanyensis]|uniref:protealysin inhibitor emfourin n=1 Tax=Streptomyces sanyensis TaxID=568869 RepID=UPI003D77C976